MIYTLTEIRNGTGFERGTRFLRITHTIRNTLAQARAAIEESIREDGSGRHADALDALTALIQDVEREVRR